MPRRARQTAKPAPLAKPPLDADIHRAAVKAEKIETMKSPTGWWAEFAQPTSRNGYWTNRKGHCRREGRGDTLLNLTPEEASGICMDQCRAMCCRGPLIPAAGS